MSTEDCNMDVAAPPAPAAVPAVATAAEAVAAFHCSSLPTGGVFHALLLNGLTHAEMHALKSRAPPGQLDFALLNADLIVGTFQLECAAVKSSLQAFRGKLKTKNIHSEFTFNLGYTGHFQTAIEFLSAKASRAVGAPAGTYNVLVCLVHGTEAKLAALGAAVAPLLSKAAPLDSLRLACDEAAIVKSYKIAESELQLSIPASSVLANTDPSTTPANDALLQAVIGRIHVKI